MVKVRPKRAFKELLCKKAGIQLDLGCGDHKQPGFVGIDKRELRGVDIVHDLEEFPFPLPKESCNIIMGSHIVEHIKPWMMLNFMDELWRIAKPGAQLAFSHPYGVNSLFVQDPTHCNPCNEATWQYFDPRYPLWFLVYKPKPWMLAKSSPVWSQAGIMEVLFNKVTEKEGASLFVNERVWDKEAASEEVKKFEQELITKFKIVRKPPIKTGKSK